MAWKAHAEFSFNHDGPALHLAKSASNGVSSFVSDMTFTDVEEGNIVIVPPPLVGSDATAFMQAVMDTAYAYGLRPSNAQDDKHMKAHLSDMRDIVRHTLKMNT